MALYAANQNHLSGLLDGNGERDPERSGLQNALRAMWKNLQSAFPWIDSEMAYTRLIINYRKNLLALTTRLLEVSGTVDRFREDVQRLNGSSRPLLEMEPMTRPLLPTPESRADLKWSEAAAGFSPAEAEPLEQFTP